MELEDYTHRALARMVASGDPSLLEQRATSLAEVAAGVRDLGQVINAYAQQVDWQGEGAEAFRAYGRHFAQESDTLSEYADSVSTQMRLASTALAEARAAMPEVPVLVMQNGPWDLEEGGMLEMLDTAERARVEEERQEAVRVVTRLESSYSAVTEGMSNLEEPRFQIPPVTRHIDPMEGGSPGTAPASPERSHVGQAPGSSPADGITPGNHSAGTSPVTPVTGSPVAAGGTSTAPDSVAVADGQVGTSLDSVGAVADRVPPTSGSPATAPGHSASPLPPSAALPSPPPPSVVSPAVGSGRSAPGVGSGPAVSVPPTRSPAGGGVPAPGGSGTPGAGQPVGRPPLAGGSPVTGVGPRQQPQDNGPVAGRPPGVSGPVGTPPSPALRQVGPPSRLVEGKTPGQERERAIPRGLVIGGDTSGVAGQPGGTTVPGSRGAVEVRGPFSRRNPVAGKESEQGSGDGVLGGRPVRGRGRRGALPKPTGVVGGQGGSEGQAASPEKRKSRAQRLESAEGTHGSTHS